MSKKPTKQNYRKVNQIEHVLKRPDMYMDDIKPDTFTDFVYDDESNKIVNKTLTESPAIIRLFTEVISNAIDNYQRSLNTDTPCTMIKVTHDEENDKVTIWNDGQVIPVELHEEEKVYNHTLVFSHMLSSSNYDDEGDNKREGSGLNGLGVKLVNIFSKEFQVRGFDPNNNKLFTQKWMNNLSETDGPNVATSKKFTKGFTEVSFILDFERFGSKKYSKDMLSLFRKLTVDCSMLTGIKVYFNGDVIPTKSLTSYSKLYNNSTSDSDDDKTPTDKKEEEDDESKSPKKNKKQLIHIKYKESEVVLVPSDNETNVTVSFANRILTSLGGVHVKTWYDTLLTPILQKLNKPNAPQLTLDEIKKFFKLFVIVNVQNPKYDNQCKRMLKMPKINAEVNKKEIINLMKWDIIEDIKLLIEMKSMAMLKGSEAKKTGGLNIKNLTLCSKAKGKEGYKCALAITEGQSAESSLASSVSNGIYGYEADYLSMYPIRGKILNTRNETANTISKNEIISNLIKIFGLRYGLDYTDDDNFKTLRHGRAILVVDQDVDGTHIMGLFINYIHHLFPTLLQRKEPFIVSLQTPLVIAYTKAKEYLFYDEKTFNQFLVDNPKMKFTADHKYYKGLGTFKSSDFKKICGVKMLEFENTSTTTETLIKVFNSKNTDQRKKWIEEYKSKVDETHIEWTNDLTQEFQPVSIDDYINKIMIMFSIEDCKRSLPFFDGLKESQRKVLYACFKRKLNYNAQAIKVAQLAGYVAEHTSYHHGEMSLNGTIVNMAQRFVGSNNIPLLEDDGQLGTRYRGGDDHAAPRYIFTKLNECTRLIFNDEDDSLLDLNYDGNTPIEPKYYIPVIPMLLINGSEGIGTGYSTKIPCHSPFDVIKQVRNWINDEKVDDIYPWYNGFKGVIEKTGVNQYISKGVINRINTSKVQITELPIGKWTVPYRVMLEELVNEKELKDVDCKIDTINVDITITEKPTGMICTEKNLKLTSKIATTNMVCFDHNSELRKFKSTSDFINYFCEVRLPYYEKRKTNMLKNLDDEFEISSNKLNFIKGVINGNITIYENNKSRNEDMIVKDLEEQKFKKITDSYNYLLNISVRSFTKENTTKLEKEVDELSDNIKTLKNTTPRELWLTDIDLLEKTIPKYYKRKEKEDEDLPLKTAKKTKKVMKKD